MDHILTYHNAWPMDTHVVQKDQIESSPFSIEPCLGTRGRKILAWESADQDIGRRQRPYIDFRQIRTMNAFVQIQLIAVNGVLQGIICANDVKRQRLVLFSENGKAPPKTQIQTATAGEERSDTIWPPALSVRTFKGPPA